MVPTDGFDQPRSIRRPGGSESTCPCTELVSQPELSLGLCSISADLTGQRVFPLTTEHIDVDTTAIRCHRCYCARTDADFRIGTRGRLGIPRARGDVVNVDVVHLGL